MGVPEDERAPAPFEERPVVQLRDVALNDREGGEPVRPHDTLEPRCRTCLPRALRVEADADYAEIHRVGRLGEDACRVAPTTAQLEHEIRPERHGDVVQLGPLLNGKVEGRRVDEAMHQLEPLELLSH